MCSAHPYIQTDRQIPFNLSQTGTTVKSINAGTSHDYEFVPEKVGGIYTDYICNITISDVPVTWLWSSSQVPLTSYMSRNDKVVIFNNNVSCLKEKGAGISSCVLHNRR